MCLDKANQGSIIILPCVDVFSFGGLSLRICFKKEGDIPWSSLGHYFDTKYLLDLILFSQKWLNAFYRYSM